MKRKLTAVIAVLVLAGCGGGDEPDTKKTAAGADKKTSAESTDAKQKTARFVEKADEICAKFNDRWVGVPEATPEYYRDWARSNADLEALDAPAQVSKEWDRYLAALEQQIRFSKAENGIALKRAYERKEKAAQEIGFADCASR